ncbi:myosin-11-like isoform X2 [Littorina saxatilis]|uniref:myosin-11-like isoform X2 n=1 Tax=Littorina saxatilis TaxID=31220 RepID=UPI0038B587C4
MTDTTQNSSSTNLNVADSHGTHTKEWDLYNKEKTLLLNFFTKAESTLQSSSELVQDEVAAQEVCKELHSTLKELKDLLKSMTECNTKLRKKIRRSRKREQLNQEMRDFSQLFDTVENQLTERLDYFQGSVVRWRECYKRLHVLCDWMLDTEAKLTRTENTTLKTTEKHVTEAKAFYNQIYEKGVTLEAIEADVKTLTTNTSSQQEHSPLTSNIALVRRKWESMCSRSLAQSENLAHWQSYRKLKKQVVLWVVRTEKQCGGELAECASPEQAETLCALCQKLLQEHEENRTVLETLRREAAYFGDLPNVIDELEIMHNRWNSIGTTLRHRLEDLQKPFVASSSSSNKASSNSEVTDTQTSGEGNISDSAAVSDRLNASQEFPLIEHIQDSASDVQSSHNGEQTHPEEETGTTVSTDDAGRAENQQKSVRAIFAEMTSNAARKEQTRTVSLPERRQTLLSRFKPVEERAKRMQQCIIESSHEIYPADMPNRIKTLQGMLAEYNQHTPATDALQQDLGDLMNTSSDEDHKSLDPHVKLLQRLDKIGDMLEARVSVCEKWKQYDSALKGLQAQLESLQKRLNNASGIAAEEATEVTSEVPRLRGALISKQKEAEGLTERMKATQVFLKDPVTHNPLHLQTQLQELEQMCDAVELMTQTKPYSHERQNSDGTGPTNTRLSDSGGPVYKVRLSQPDLQNQERMEHHTTSSEARTSVSSGSEVNIGQANTVAITSTDITEEGEPNAIPSSQTEETPSDTNPSSPSDDISTAGMAVNVGYADTVTISMSTSDSCC